MGVRKIPVGQIQTHWERNRNPNKEHIHALARHMNEDGFNGAFPLQVVAIGAEKELHLAAGHHRLAAARLKDLTYPNLPLAEVWAEITPGTMDDVIRLMQEDNFRNDPGVNPRLGLPLTRDEKAAQCKALLMFPDVFRRSDRELAKDWGCHYNTVRGWREDVSAQIVQIAAAAERATSPDEKQAVLEEFGISATRLHEMVALIRSGEREVTRGGQTFTQNTVAGEDKKQDARKAAAMDYRQVHEGVLAEIERHVSDKPTLNKSNLKRRLYQTFNLNHAANASKWPLQPIQEQAEKMKNLLGELRHTESVWCQELQLTHEVRTEMDKLVNLGGPFLVDDVAPLRHEVARLATADWENEKPAARLNVLTLLRKNIPKIFQAEREARDASAKRNSLHLAIDGALAACRRLREFFMSLRWQIGARTALERFSRLPTSQPPIRADR